MEHLNTLGLLTVTELMSKLNSFKYPRLDSQNKIPKDVFNEHSLGKDKGFSLSATHFWTLVRIFPLIFGKQLQDDPIYNLFLNLLEIFFELNSHSFTESKLVFLENKIESFLKEFKSFYPNIKITAKLHNMIHYPRSIRQNGPCNQTSTIRFESKHNEIKRKDHANNNHINPTKSIVTRHQDAQLYYLMSANYFNLNTLGPHHNVELTLNAMIRSTVTDNPNYSFVKWAEFNGIKYQLGDIICYDNTNEKEPKFGQISALIGDEYNLIFYLAKFQTMAYVSHMRAYHLNTIENSMHLSINLKDLANKFPNDLYEFGNIFYLSLKYPLE